MNDTSFPHPTRAEDDATSSTTDPSLDQPLLLDDVALPSKRAFAIDSGIGIKKNNVAQFAAENPNAAGDSQTELHYIVAPPGALGLVLKLLSNNRGHAIAQLKADSPLHGIMHAGDKIQSMTVDMHKKSLSEAVALLNQNWNYERRVTLRKMSGQAVQTAVIPIGQCGLYPQVESDTPFLGVPLPRFLRAPKPLKLADFALRSMTVHTEALSRESLKELLAINWSEERRLAVMSTTGPTAKKISAHISKESTRTVIVPAGKMRLQRRSPPPTGNDHRPILKMITAVDPNSPLEGLLPGDIIFGIDEIDATKMTGPELLFIWSERCNQERKLTVCNRNHPRTIVVPPGDLFINFHFEKGSQPFISSAHKGSPVEGLLWEGDSVLAIDGMETRLMTRKQVTSALSANKQRTLLVHWSWRKSRVLNHPIASCRTAGGTFLKKFINVVFGIFLGNA